ncbi:MAG: hypothetical protein RMJ67_04310 [Elusimicrobiota bacterium]|nr:hypothetical protein [Endomicrobiia bacterium]MDW8165716.1 hypothetical protein [Elusimicrobiota bacterium]
MKIEKNKKITKCSVCGKEVDNDNLVTQKVFSCCGFYEIKICKECADEKKETNFCVGCG